MGIYIMYSVIVLIATTVGAGAGIGGGIIIKPMFDLISVNNLDEISFLSANAVFFMSLFATFKLFFRKNSFNLKVTLIIAFSSVLGGILGNRLFGMLFMLFSHAAVQALQSFALCLTVIFLIVFFTFRDRFRQHCIRNTCFIIILGTVLGFISAFLSIGGGPLNVALYTMFLGFTLKESVIYSLATILFAQGTQLIDFACDGGFSAYPYEYLFFIVPAAILGGIIGKRIYALQSENGVRITLICTMIAVLGVNVYNLYGAVSAL